MASRKHQDLNSATQMKKKAIAPPTMNATANFKAGMLDLERRINAAGQRSYVTCFGGRQSLPSIRNPAEGQMEGKKLLRVLSAFSCISLKTLSSPNTSSRKTSLEAQEILQSTTAKAERRSEIDQRILLRIVMWGGPNTLLLLAPFDAPAESVIGMVLDSYVKGFGLQKCQDFELFCAHCNSPALHPKQPIGSVGSRHFLLCKKGPQISGISFLSSHSQISQISQTAHSASHSSTKHSHSSSYSVKHSRSLSHDNYCLSKVPSGSQSHHRRSNSWWNPKQCLTVGQH